MNREKLEFLRDNIHTIPDAEFNIGEWKCGSQGCVIGHLGPKIGIEIWLDPSDSKYEPCFEGRRGWDAVARCLGIPESEAYELLDPNDYDTKQTVIDRITEFLNG